MPITKSAQKSMRQDRKRQKVNLLWKKQLKEKKKEIEKLVNAGKNKEAEKLIPSYCKVIDKATKNHIIKKNTAARKKSRMVKFISRKTETPKKESKEKKK
ncbi:MAG: 30S ribosomal protein S20 [Candidatus Pacebacteria bacterium]|jgi:small subunit ribosomal protein S20|nr:30S ribosomal protein S20 [Candidatus Paceibacterota bacterium]